MTNETKQTAVEQLFVGMLQIQQAGILLTFDEYFELLENFKKIEIEQHATTWNNGISAVAVDEWESFEQYYEETYGGNK